MTKNSLLKLLKKQDYLKNILKKMNKREKIYQY